MGMLIIIQKRTFGHKEGIVSVVHRTTEDNWPSKLVEINPDPKGNWYGLARKKIDQKILCMNQSNKIKLQQGETRRVKNRQWVR
jgi:hypothetical protein